MITEGSIDDYINILQNKTIQSVDISEGSVAFLLSDHTTFYIFSDHSFYMGFKRHTLN
jgi:hypothetical protein